LNSVIEFVKHTHTVSSTGADTVVETKRAVYASVRSIGMKEFYQAQMAGLQPEIAFRIRDCLDYQNELYVDYNSVRYHVIRTYRTGKQLDIICKTEVNA